LVPISLPLFLIKTETDTQATFTSRQDNSPKARAKVTVHRHFDDYAVIYNQASAIDTKFADRWNAAAMADVAVKEPVNGMVELAGPQLIPLDELVRQFLRATGDARKVTTDVHALYFGIELNDQSLTPGDNPRIGPTRFEDWLSRSIPQG
jgi:hypothetical protein